MRLLLDECLPRGLRRDLGGHEVRTVPESGWAGKKNGELLQLAEARFDAFITVDRAPPSQRIEDVQPLMPLVLEALTSAEPGQIIRIPPNRTVAPPGLARG